MFWFTGAVATTLLRQYISTCQTGVCVCVLSSVQFSSKWYLCAWKSPYALHPISQKFPQHRLWNDSSVWLIDDGPLSSFQGRLSSISSLMLLGGRLCVWVCVHQCVYVNVCVCVFPEWFWLMGWRVGVGASHLIMVVSLAPSDPLQVIQAVPYCLWVLHSTNF